MHIEFLVEEYSAETLLNSLLPLMLPEGTTFAIRAFSGKHDLLSNLPKRLRGYREWLPEDWRIVVLVDKDRDDCLALKARLERMALHAGFNTKASRRGTGKFDVINRIAIEELEAWFFGDTEALTKAYPWISRSIGNKSQYRNPDGITGGTWETLERILKKAGYYPGGIPKIETARAIAKYMDPSRNRSKSFQVFRDALLQLS